MSKKNELATPNANAGVATPEWLAGSAPLGMENVHREDITIPRYNIVQSLSPERQKTDAKYIPGIEEGQIFNNVTQEVLPENFNFIDVFYTRSYGVFTKRESGGGFKGQFSTMDEAQRFLASQPDANQLEVMDTGIHVIVRLDEDGKPVETAILYMAKSKLRVSRQINTILKGKGVARFATVWEMTTTPEKSPKGPYYNYKVADKGWASKELFEYGKKVYDEVSKKDISTAAAPSDAADVEY